MKAQTLEALVDSYQKAKAVIEETEAEKAVIQDAILEVLRAMKVTGLKTQNGYLVTKVQSMSFSGVSLSTARELSSTKMEEKVDTGKLKELHQKGVRVSGAKSIVYVKITEVK